MRKNNQEEINPVDEIYSKYKKRAMKSSTLAETASEKSNESFKALEDILQKTQ